MIHHGKEGKKYGMGDFNAYLLTHLMVSYLLNSVFYFLRFRCVYWEYAVKLHRPLLVYKTKKYFLHFPGGNIKG